MSDFGNGAPWDPDDPLRSLAEVAELTDIGDATEAAVVRRRGRRRRLRKRAALVAVVGVLGAASVVGISTLRDEPTIEVVATPIEHDPPVFVAENPAWIRWEIDGVVDRDGDAAPVYRRIGDPDRLVILLGDGAPCLDKVTCVEPAVDDPDDIGFLDSTGPFADWTAVYVPNWTSDLHLGRRADARIEGVRGVQQFVGASNVDAVVDRIAQSRGSVETQRLVLAGIGAGAVGALEHASSIIDRLSPARTHLLVDGAIVPGPNSGFPACMARIWNRTWGAGLVVDDDAVPPFEGFAADAARIGEAQVAVILHDRDVLLRRFFGLAVDGCALVADPIPQKQYRQLLDRVAAETDALDNWSVIVRPGGRHTIIDAGADDPVTEWVQAVLRPIADPPS